MFSKAHFTRAIKPGIVWERVKQALEKAFKHLSYNAKFHRNTTPPPPPKKKKKKKKQEDHDGPISLT